MIIIVVFILLTRFIKVLVLFKNVVNKAMELQHDVPFEVYTELLDCVSSLIGETGSYLFSAQDLLLFLQVLNELCLSTRRIFDIGLSWQITFLAWLRLRLVIQ